MKKGPATVDAWIASGLNIARDCPSLPFFGNETRAMTVLPPHSAKAKGIFLESVFVDKHGWWSWDILPDDTVVLWRIS